MSDHQHAEELNGEAPVEPQDGQGYDMPPPPSAEARRALTAFLVVVDEDGTAWGTNDCNLDLVLARPATVSDMWRGCAEVQRDIESTMQAERTVNLMVNATAQIAESQRQQKIAAKLHERGIRVPGR